MRARFVRQTVLPQVGEAGQTRLLGKKVLVAGCGALGTHTAEALLRAGVQHLVLVDRDVVEEHNLHRVSLFTPGDVGRPKAEAAAEKLRSIDPQARIDVRVAHLDGALAEELVPQVDLVVDGLDNLETRYVVNEACVKHERPWVYTAVLATYGMIMGIWPGRGPCLRCLFPNPPGPGTIPTCAEAGILGPVPGALASIQAATALRLLLEGPTAPVGTLLYLDLWGLRAQSVEVKRNPSCPTCVDRVFVFLQGSSGAAILCGDTVQVLPGFGTTLDLGALAARLSHLGRVEVHHGVLFAELAGTAITVFPDGRALFKGIRDPRRAQALYDQYIAR